MSEDKSNSEELYNVIPTEITHGINDWASILKMVGHPQRLSILYTLCKKPSSVKDMQDKLNMPQSVLSQHLGLLRRAHLVKREKVGTLAIYSIGQDRLRHLMDTICQLPSEDAEWNKGFAGDENLGREKDQ